MTIFTLYNQVYIHIGYMISNVDLFQIWRIAVKMLNFSKDRGQIPTSKEQFWTVLGRMWSGENLFFLPTLMT